MELHFIERCFSGHRVVHSNDTMTAPESNLVVDMNTATAAPDFIATLSVENHSHTIQSDPPIEDAPITSEAPPFHEISAGNEIPSSEDCDDRDSTLQEEIENGHDSECEFPGQDAGGEIIMQLKEKFHSTDECSEKVKILTVLPKSWCVRKIVKEFGASNYVARQAKKLVLEKGFLSSPNPKPGKALPDRTQQLVLEV
eukprot:Em0014g707a